MADAWISNIGIRVTNLERSLAFYNKVFDLEELKRASDADSAYVLLRDRRSHQRIELNWYAEQSPFFVAYSPGEGLDHFDVRVRDVPEALDRLRSIGILPATTKLWVNLDAVRGWPADAPERDFLDRDVWVLKNGHRVTYIQDPDGNFIALYDHPEEPWDGPIPDHY